MQGPFPTRGTTLAILLGASEFPKCQPLLCSSPAFLNSAQEFKRYLLAADGLGLPVENVLDLFDAQDAAPLLNERVENFLKQRKIKSKEIGCNAADIIVYYVGHGGFSNPGDEYFLAIHQTTIDNEYFSSYAIKMLANTLRTHATHLRKYLILDSCFSAAAQVAFQAAGAAALEVAKRQTMEVLPKKGTALLCAAGPRDPAKVLPNEKYTMFSGAFLDSLRTGSERMCETLSLSEIGELTQLRIEEQFPDRAVRPQVHYPDQTDGSLANVRLFPNPATLQRHLDATTDTLCDDGLPSSEKARNDFDREPLFSDEKHLKPKPAGFLRHKLNVVTRTTLFFIITSIVVWLSVYFNHNVRPLAPSQSNVADATTAQTTNSQEDSTSQLMTQHGSDKQQGGGTSMNEEFLRLRNHGGNLEAMDIPRRLKQFGFHDTKVAPYGSGIVHKFGSRILTFPFLGFYVGLNPKHEYILGARDSKFDWSSIIQNADGDEADNSPFVWFCNKNLYGELAGWSLSKVNGKTTTVDMYCDILLANTAHDVIEVSFSKPSHLLYLPADVTNHFCKITNASVSVVVDASTHLMWFQTALPPSGYVGAVVTKDCMNYSGCGGFRDWRIPTLEEAMSLMEPSTLEHDTSDLFLDRNFDLVGTSIWTSDYINQDGQISVNYHDGNYEMSNPDYVHDIILVRTLQP